MLARLAENLFWIGRYLARAEETARLVDVTYHRLLESPPTEVASTWEELLDQLHMLDTYLDQQAAGDFTAIRPDEVLRFVVLDEANPSSVVASMSRARDNTRSVRELVSSETWLTINDLYLRLRGRDLEAELTDRPFDVFRTVTRGCQTITGVVRETMPRDDSYLFLTLGQMLERAHLTARLVEVGYDQLVGDASYQRRVALLRSIGALESFRRTFGASTDTNDMLWLLLLDAQHPRSVVFALNRAKEALDRLDGPTGRSLRSVGRVRASLGYRDVEELLEVGLHDFLATLQQRLRTTSTAIAEEFFLHLPPGGMHALSTA